MSNFAINYIFLLNSKPQFSLQFHFLVSEEAVTTKISEENSAENNGDEPDYSPNGGTPPDGTPPDGFGGGTGNTIR